MLTCDLQSPIQFAPEVVAEVGFRRFVRNVVDERELPEIVEGERTVQLAVFVQGAVELAIGDHPAVAEQPPARQPVERSRAVRTQAVVPARFLVQVVDRSNVIEERGPHDIDPHGQVIQPSGLGRTVFRPPQNRVTFVDDEEDEFLLTIETADH